MSMIPIYPPEVQKQLKEIEKFSSERMEALKSYCLKNGFTLRQSHEFILNDLDLKEFQRLQISLMASSVVSWRVEKDLKNEESAGFLKTWEDYNKAREATSILIEDLESREPESFAERYRSCEKCFLPYELTDEGIFNLKALTPGEYLKFSCKTCRGLIELFAEPKK